MTRMSLPNAYLNEKEPHAKIQFLNNFKHHHIVAKLSITGVGYDK